MSPYAVFTFCVSHAHVFTADQSSGCDYGYQAYRELTGFTNCLLQKIKAAQTLPLIVKWENFILPNHSRFPPIEEKQFLAGSQIAVALEEVGNFYLWNEFRKDARKFLEELECTVP